MFESVQNDGTFYLKPGGTMEEALPTELPGNLYSEVSGITKQGATCKMPGKGLVAQYADRVLQIVAFGNGYLLQHGSTVEYHPDTCKQGKVFTLDLPNSVFPPFPGSGPIPGSPGEEDYQPRLVDVALMSVDEANVETLVHSWNETEFLVDPTKAGHWVPGLTLGDYKKLDFSEFVPDDGGKYAFRGHVIDYNGTGADQDFPNIAMSFTAITSIAPEGSSHTGGVSGGFGPLDVFITDLAQVLNLKFKFAINLD